MDILLFDVYCLKKNKSISNISLVLSKHTQEWQKRKENKEHDQTIIQT